MQHSTIISRRSGVLSLFVCLTLLIQAIPVGAAPTWQPVPSTPPAIPTSASAFPSPTAALRAAAPPAGSSVPPAGTCDLYPIALHTQTLADVAAGTQIDDIFNGSQSGTFGWLTWGGSPGEPTLVASLTPPGDSGTYVNPDNPTDHTVSVGDRVQGRPGVANSKAVRDALNQLKALDITVPVWDAAEGSGNTSTYRVINFAQLRLTDYRLSGQDRISARFLSYATCGDVPPPPPPTTCLAYAVHDESVNDSQFFTIDPRDHTIAVLGPLHKDYDIEGLDRHPVTGELYASAGSDNRHGQDGFLYRVDRQSGALAPIGRSGFSEVVALAFHPTDAGLWGWSKGTGLIRIDVTSGAGTLVLRSTRKIEGLAWSADGARLYASAGATLWRYDPGANTLTQIARNLPGATEGLDTRPDGQLVGSIDGQDAFRLFTYDVAALRVVTNEQIATAYDDVESIAWPESCEPTANSAPVATGDAYAVDEDAILDVPAPGVLANDTDPDGDSLTALPISGSISGTLTLNPDGSFRYIPDANFSGVDSFSYQAHDSMLASAVVTATITVTAVNSPPAIVSAPLTSAAAGQAYRYAVDAADPDAGDMLTFTLEVGPLGMTIDPATGVLAWDLSAEQTGVHEVALRVQDAAGLSDSQRFTLAVNNPPLALGDVYAVDEDGSLIVPAPGVLSNDSDLNNDPLTATLVSSTLSGTLVFSPDGAFDYTPNPATFQGVDRFIYTVSDGRLTSQPATVTIAVNPLPVVVPDVIGMAPPAATETITRAELTMGHVTTVDGAITLDFRGLPSEQGWIYGGHHSVSETRIYSVSNGILHQNTIGIGSTSADYGLNGLVDPNLPFILSIRARVLEVAERTNDNPFGFVFGVETGSGELYEVGLVPGLIAIYPLSYPTTVDTTVFHDYRLEGTPGVGYRLFVDDVLMATGSPARVSGPSRIFLGDGTNGANARAEVASYFFTQPRVISQDPIGGAKVLRGSPVDLVVASGPGTVIVPNVVGMAQADAEATIRAANLTVGAITMEYSASVPAGHVIRQKPLAGMAVIKGIAVALVVSLGPQNVIVPDVIGMTQSAAETTISMAELTVGNITTIPGAVTLDFSVLPGTQGWSDPRDPSCRYIPESSVFSIEGGILYQNTMGIEACGPRYNLNNVVDPSLPYTLTVRTRVLQEEGHAGNHYGFSFGAFTGSEECAVGIGPSHIAINAIIVTFDNTHFRNYRMEGIPGVACRLFVDDVLIRTSPPERTQFTNSIFLGDGTRTANARAEVASYSFVQPQVIHQTPGGGTSIVADSAIDLTVATGPATVTVPDVIGLVPDDARAAILAANLAVGTITSGYSAHVPAGRIFNHQPSAGTNVTPQSGVNLMVSLGPISCVQPPEDMVSWWPGNEDGRDIAGTNDGSPHGDTHFAPGVVGPAFYLDGAGDYVEVPDAPSHDVDSAFTIEAWVYPMAGSGGIVTKVDTGSSSGSWHMEYDGTTQRVSFTMSRGSGSAQTISTPPVSVPRHLWSHVAVTFDGRTLNIYVNGVLLSAAGSSPSLSNDFTLLLGAYQRNGVKEFFFNGRIDEVTLYQRALTAAEIKAVIDAGSAGKCQIPPMNPVAVDDTYSIAASTTLSVPAPGLLANDYDGNRDPLAAHLVDGSDQGVVSLNVDGSFTYLPGPSFGGVDRFTYTASDGQRESNVATVTIDLNDPPTITSTPPTTGAEGQPYSYDVEATDLDAGDVLSFTLTSAPIGMAIDRLTGLIRWTPGPSQAGPHNVVVQVADRLLATATQSYSITIAEAGNNAPVVTSTPVTTATEGLPYTYDVEAADADNDVLTFSLIAVPLGMTIDAATGVIRWTPSATQAGSYPVDVRVVDGRGGRVRPALHAGGRRGDQQPARDHLQP